MKLERFVGGWNLKIRRAYFFGYRNAVTAKTGILFSGRASNPYGEGRVVFAATTHRPDQTGYAFGLDWMEAPLVIVPVGADLP